jgi:hypothetical protein
MITILDCLFYSLLVLSDNSYLINLMIVKELSFYKKKIILDCLLLHPIL